MVSRYTAMCDFPKQAPIAVAPGYVLGGRWTADAPGREMESDALICCGLTRPR
jgi:hypothetical protein